MIGCDLPLSHSVSCKWQEWPSPALGNGGGGAHVHKCCGTSDIRQVGPRGALQTPPWGWGGPREEVTLHRVLMAESK